VLNFETSYLDKKQFVKNVSEDEDGRHSRSTIYGSEIDCFTFYRLHTHGIYPCNSTLTSTWDYIYIYETNERKLASG
jgi:hypothetical protein